MTANCGTGRYYDSVVGRCQGCHEICYGHQLTDPTSDCNTFCPGFNKPDVPSNNVIALSDSLTLSPVEIAITVVTCCAIVVVVSIIVSYIIKRSNQRQMPNNPITMTSIQVMPNIPITTTAIQEMPNIPVTTTAIQETKSAVPEQGFPDLPYANSLITDPLMSS